MYNYIKLLITVILFSLIGNSIKSQNLEVIVQKKHQSAIQDIIFSPSGKYFATKGSDEVFLWEVKSLKQVMHSNDLPSGFSMDKILFNRKDQFLFHGHKGLGLYDLTTGTTSNIIINNNNSFLLNRFIFANDLSRDITVIDPETLKKISYTNTYLDLSGAVFANNQSLLAVSSNTLSSEGFMVFDYTNWQKKCVYSFDTGDRSEPMEELGFIDNDKSVIAAIKIGSYHRIIAVNIETGKAKTLIDESKKYFLRSYHQGRQLIAMEAENTIHLIDAISGKTLFRGDCEISCYTKFSPSGYQFAFESKKQLVLVDLKSYKPIVNLPFGGISFSPTEEHFILYQQKEIDFGNYKTSLSIYTAKQPNLPLHTIDLPIYFGATAIYKPEHKGIAFEKGDLIDLSKFDIRPIKEKPYTDLGSGIRLFSTGSSFYAVNTKTQKEVFRVNPLYIKFIDFKRKILMAIEELPSKTDSILREEYKYFKGFYPKDNEFEEYKKEVLEGFESLAAKGVFRVNMLTGQKTSLGGYFILRNFNSIPSSNEGYFGFSIDNQITIVNIENPKLKYILDRNQLKPKGCSSCRNEIAYFKGTELFRYEDSGIYAYSFINNTDRKVDGVLAGFSSEDRIKINYEYGYAVKQRRGDEPLILNLPDYTPRATIPVQSKNAFDVSFIPGSSRFFLNVSDGRIICYDGATALEQFKIITDGISEFVIVLPDGTYTATKNALDRIVFRKDGKIFNFEQFDLILNRPDKVFQQIGESTPEIINAYYNAYLRRVKKMGFSLQTLSINSELPEVKVNSPIPFESQQPDLPIEITAKSFNSTIDRINIYVNNVPVFGKMGDRLSEKISNVTKKYQIKLSKGINKIEVSTHSSKGIESYRENFNVIYKGSELKPDLFLVSIGVSDFENNDFDLTYASKDANDIAQAFGSKESDYAQIHKFVLTDKDVTIENVKKIKQELQRSKVDDQVIVFVASHGLLDKGMNYFIGISAIDFNNPSKNGLPYDVLEDLLDKIPSRKKIMMIDACHSGEVDMEDVVVTSNQSIQGGLVKQRGFITTAKTQLGLNNSFDLMQQLFADLRKTTGAVVISSAGGAEFAFESSEWNNGVFTYSVLEGLLNGRADFNKDKQIVVSELQKYVFARVKELTQGKQNPTSRQENLEFDFRVW